MGEWENGEWSCTCTYSALAAESRQNIGSTGHGGRLSHWKSDRGHHRHAMILSVICPMKKCSPLDKLGLHKSDGNVHDQRTSSAIRRISIQTEPSMHDIGLLPNPTASESRTKVGETECMQVIFSVGLSDLAWSSNSWVEKQHLRDKG